ALPVDLYTILIRANLPHETQGSPGRPAERSVGTDYRASFFAWPGAGSKYCHIDVVRIADSF
ncbi:hypothetical protein ACWIVX_04825, partial [Enterobacter asburiae]